MPATTVDKAPDPAKAGLRFIEELSKLGEVLQDLSSRIDHIERRFAALETPAATPLSVRELSRKHPAFSEGSLRWLLFHRESNGLAQAVIRSGRRLLVDERRFLAWVDSLREGADVRLQLPPRRCRGRFGD
ncbi:MAG TPA: hypothetical protein VOA87_08360 [Thermoanaerobaculia bacterium]|nr:hypothetical protein [Thermoanaerobaculia bacterium]